MWDKIRLLVHNQKEFEKKMPWTLNRCFDAMPGATRLIVFGHVYICSGLFTSEYNRV